MSDSAPAVDLEVRLRYRHGLGALAPYFAALAEGRALASRRRADGRTCFPPRIDERESAFEWVELPGTGRVVAATEGEALLPLSATPIHARFALVAMDGADNAAFGRVESPAPVVPGDRVRLVAAGGAPVHPAQAAVFVPEPTEPEP